MQGGERAEKGESLGVQPAGYLNQEEDGGVALGDGRRTTVPYGVWVGRNASKSLHQTSLLSGTYGSLFRPSLRTTQPSTGSPGAVLLISLPSHPATSSATA